ncbi:pyridoxal phosphate-dependent aminotransferase [bacterium]|nr:pyridoxal phosphate-dependent aminotransferase [bacterium]
MTFLGRTLDKIPFHLLNKAATQLAGQNAGRLRSHLIRNMLAMHHEISASLRRGVPSYPCCRPLYMRNLSCGDPRAGVNNAVETWLSESAFGFGAIIGAMEETDKSSPDSPGTLDILREADAAAAPRKPDASQIAAPIAKLSIGAPGSLPPRALVEKEIALLSTKDPAELRSLYAYLPGPGSSRTLDAVSARYGEQFGVKISRSEVMMLASCKSAIFTFLMAVLNPGEEVGGMTPEFPMHRSVPEILGHRYIAWEPRIDRGRFSYSIADLERLLDDHPRLRVLILSYPGNPAPFMFSEENLRDIVDLCLRRSVRIYVDAPYHEIIYPQIPGNRYPNILKAHPAARDICVISLSESKRLAIPGRRIGYLIAPEGIIRAVTRLAINFWSCPNAMNDRLMHWAYTEGYAGIEEWVRNEAHHYGEKAAHTFGRLKELEAEGFLHIEQPRGGFYAFPILTGETLQSPGMRALAERGLEGVRGLAIYLLLAYKTAAIPGTSFADPDSFVGRHGIRISFAGRPVEDVAVGLERFCRALRALRNGSVLPFPDKYIRHVDELLAVL